MAAKSDKAQVKTDDHECIETGPVKEGQQNNPAFLPIISCLPVEKKRKAGDKEAGEGEGGITMGSHVPFVPPPETRLGLSFPDWSRLLRDEDYVGDGDSRMVRVQTLRRLGQLRGVVQTHIPQVQYHNGNYVAFCMLTVKEPDGTISHWSNVGEASSEFLLEPFNEHPASNAATRAESRALRMLLNITTVSDVEAAHSKSEANKREAETMPMRQILSASALRRIEDEEVLAKLRELTGQQFKRLPEEVGVSVSSKLFAWINNHEKGK